MVVNNDIINHIKMGVSRFSKAYWKSEGCKISDMSSDFRRERLSFER